MKRLNRRKLEQAGFRVGTAQEFLQLSGEEMALIELKVRLVEILEDARKSKGLTQRALAELIGSSQSRVAKMENGDPNVSIDLICRTLFALGVSRQVIGRAIAAPRAA